MQELAHGELRAVCADEVGRVFREFTSNFDQEVMAPAVKRVCHEEIAPRDGVARAEATGLAEAMNSKLAEVHLRMEEHTAAFGTFAKECATRLLSLEELQSMGERQRVSQEERFEAQMRNANSKEIASSSELLTGLGSRCAELEGRVRSLDERGRAHGSRCDGLEARFHGLHGSLTDEAAERTSLASRLCAGISELSTRIDDSQAFSQKMGGQASAATATAEGALQRLAELWRCHGEESDRQKEAVRLIEAAASTATQSAESARERCMAAERFASEAATVANTARAKAECTGDSTASARAQAVEARSLAADASTAATRSDIMAAQNQGRLAAAEASLEGLHRYAKQLSDRLASTENQSMSGSFAMDFDVPSTALCADASSDRPSGVVEVTALRRLLAEQAQLTSVFAEGFGLLVPLVSDARSNGAHGNANAMVATIGAASRAMAATAEAFSDPADDSQSRQEHRVRPGALMSQEAVPRVKCQRPGSAEPSCSEVALSDWDDDVSADGTWFINELTSELMHKVDSLFSPSPTPGMSSSSLAPLLPQAPQTPQAPHAPRPQAKQKGGAALRL